jgi:hypothetical protein
MMMETNAATLKMQDEFERLETAECIATDDPRLKGN